VTFLQAERICVLYSVFYDEQNEKGAKRKQEDLLGNAEEGEN
jgi:hypothetical protein